MVTRCWAARIAAAKASPTCWGHLVHGHLVRVWRLRCWAVADLGGNAGPGDGLGSVPGFQDDAGGRAGRRRTTTWQGRTASGAVVGLGDPRARRWWERLAGKWGWSVRWPS